MSGGAGGARLSEEGGHGPTVTVFVSDPTAEAERIVQALRASHFVVVDVPLSMLVARVAVQRPRVILVDADGEGALDVVARMRELPNAEDIHVLFVARPGGAISSPEEALAHEGSGLFVRPVEVATLVSKVESLTASGHAAAPVSARAAQQPSLPPAGIRSAAVSAIPDSRPSAPRSGPPSSPGSPSQPPPLAESPTRASAGLAPPVSAELQQLLDDAERRVQGRAESEAPAPSPEEEIEAVLPAELLAALDEPLEEDEDDAEIVAPARAPSRSPGVRERTSGGGSRTTGAATTGGGTPNEAKTPRPITSEEPLAPSPGQPGGTQAGPTGAGISTTGDAEPRQRSDFPRSSVPPVDAALPSAFGPDDGIRVVARAIASRTDASLCFSSGDVERRLVLRDGDVVTAASTAADESLLAFLGARGDLPRETLQRLGPKFPPFGRHGGAALVARGYLRQDQMWPTLRAHAEWVMTRILQTDDARVVVEAQAPGRLASEPGVFGGSTGAQVFVELVRRIVSPVEAMERLGGPASRIGEAPVAQLLAECALGADDVAQVRAASGRALRELVEGSPEGDLVTVLLALAHLSVVEILRAVDDGARPGEAMDPAIAALDGDAIRERVRARAQLVDDGDYFAVLGVPRDATGYEVRRAFLELRRSFDPSRVLTPDVADLGDDVRKITFVLEEAYEILKDAARRERYRRAIESS